MGPPNLTPLLLVLFVGVVLGQNTETTTPQSSSVETTTTTQNKESTFQNFVTIKSSLDDKPIIFKESVHDEYSNQGSQQVRTTTEISSTTIPSVIPIQEEQKLNDTAEVNITTNSSTKLPSKGRAIDFSNSFDDSDGKIVDIDEMMPTHNVIADKNKLKIDSKGLDDVSMDDDEDIIIGGDITKSKAEADPILSKDETEMVHCVSNGTTYKVGHTLDKHCEGLCKCTAEGTWRCDPRCEAPYVMRTSSNNLNDLKRGCREMVHPTDECCAVLVCAADTTGNTTDVNCTHGNTTYKAGDRFQVGCESICHCSDSGSVSCEPRCPKAESSDNKENHCVSVQDPRDSCCKVLLCDVTLDDTHRAIDDVTTHDDQNPMLQGGFMPSDGLMSTNSTTKVINKNNTLVNDVGEKNSVTQASQDKNKMFMMTSEKKETEGCEFEGKVYSPKEEFHKGCAELCVCLPSEKSSNKFEASCLPISCPNSFGLDVVDPHCLRWEPDPPGFEPKAPHCCPEKMRCADNGTCTYKGRSFENWSSIPTALTGCTERCFCEGGNVDCRPGYCPEVGSKPTCKVGTIARLVNLDGEEEGDDCCQQWKCEKDNDVVGLTPNKTGKTSKNQQNSMLPSGNKPLSPFPGPYAPDNSDPITKDPVKPNKFPGPLANLPGPFNIDNAIKPSQKDKVKPTTVNYQDHYYTSQDDEDDKDTVYDFKPDLNNPGPGFFNPSVSKTQYQDFDNDKNPNLHNQGINNLGPTNQGHFVNGQGPIALPPNQPSHPLLGVPLNGQIPTGVRLEHLLQHLSGAQGVQPPPGFNPGQQHLYPNRPQQQGPFLNVPGSYGVQEPKITVVSLDAIDAQTVRLVFSVPAVLVGLHGRVELRYTPDSTNGDISTWASQIFAPPDDLIATPQLEFELGSLRPDTEYKVRVTLLLRSDVSLIAGSGNGAEITRVNSDVYRVRTPARPNNRLPFPVSPPLGGLINGPPSMIPIEPEFVLLGNNATTLEVSWRKLNPEELQFVDAVQLRFKEIDAKVYSATPLIHRSVTRYTIEGLKPATSYDVGIFFIPFAGQNVELKAEDMLRVKTEREIDVYGFELKINATKIKSTTMEVNWSGVPYPEDKYVNVYRAIYQSETGKEDSSVFKVAKRDSTGGALVKDLKPGTKYRLWLEAYLTNGKIKKSAVIDLLTKPGIPQDSQTDKLSSMPSKRDNSSDYYSSLVVVAVIAALAVLSTLILLLILTRRGTRRTASITAPSAPTRTTNGDQHNRKITIAESAYDNPTYKVEIQQETMNL